MLAQCERVSDATATDIDQDDSRDDDCDPDHRGRRQHVLVDPAADHRDRDRPDAGPDRIRRAERQVLQRQCEEHEREDVGDEGEGIRDDAREAVRRAQRDGAGHLGGNREAEQEPDVHVTSASRTTSRRNGTASPWGSASSSSAYRRPSQTAAAIVPGAQASPIARTERSPASSQSPAAILQIAPPGRPRAVARSRARARRRGAQLLALRVDARDACRASVELEQRPRRSDLHVPTRLSRRWIRGCSIVFTVHSETRGAGVTSVTACPAVASSSARTPPM